MADIAGHPYFFCGIGGSGMLPLATILRGLGAEVGGSDRSFDQGRTPEKRDWLRAHGFALHPQDGSGIVSGEQVLIASAAIEDTVPEVAKAKELGCERLTRAQLLARLFNAAPHSLGIAGTSGKSTVTGMLGWILDQAGLDPTVMNGAVMKNFSSSENPFASARVGGGGYFVSEVDESDGSIALYEPEVAVLLNVSLDHMSMEELRALFGQFVARASIAAVNFDNEEARLLGEQAKEVVSFAIDHPEAAIGIEPGTIEEDRQAIAAIVLDRRDGTSHPLRLPMPGRHNLANALAALASAIAAGVELREAVSALHSFEGLARRFEMIGTSASDITVIDDFGHNPEKCRATLRTLKSQPGRVIAFFQPHGYGPLRQMGHELAATFADTLGEDDITIMCDPVYFGGTVDRLEGTARIVALIRERGGQAEHIPERSQCADRIAAIARPGDRVVVMGARDDTLSKFAAELLALL